MEPIPPKRPRPLIAPGAALILALLVLLPSAAAAGLRVSLGGKEVAHVETAPVTRAVAGLLAPEQRAGDASTATTAPAAGDARPVETARAALEADSGAEPLALGAVTLAALAVAGLAGLARRGAWARGARRAALVALVLLASGLGALAHASPAGPAEAPWWWLALIGAALLLAGCVRAVADLAPRRAAAAPDAAYA